MNPIIPFSPPDITGNEISRVEEVLRSGWLTTGPRVRELERAIALFCGTGEAVCLSSCTAALELTLRLLGIGPGDEVLTTPYTYTATAAAILHTGARPVFADLAPGTLEMDPDQLERAVNGHTKAILAVDVAGRPCDYGRLRALSESLSARFTPESPLQQALGRMAVLADAAHSFGAMRDGRASGRLADFTCFSFHAVKNLTTGEGGAITWQPVPGIPDEDIARQLRLFSLHGQTRTALEKSQGAWEYDVVCPGWKCNMTDIAAAIGLGQLDRWTFLQSRRRKNCLLYDELLEDAPLYRLPHCGRDWRSSRHLYMVWPRDCTLPRRNRLLADLAERGIACNVHYKPLPLLTAYRQLGFHPRSCPVALSVYEGELSLPLYPSLTPEQVFTVASALRELL